MKGVFLLHNSWHTVAQLTQLLFVGDHALGPPVHGSLLDRAVPPQLV